MLLGASSYKPSDCTDCRIPAAQAAWSNTIWGGVTDITLGGRPLADQRFQPLLLLAADGDMLWRTSATHGLSMPGFSNY